MDNMEDSGFDSDAKVTLNGTTFKNDIETTENGTSGTKPGHARRGSDLHKKLEKQREAAKKVIEQQPKKQQILSRKRLMVPNKDDVRRRSEAEQLLVAIEGDSDESEDEFSVGPMSQVTSKEIAQQLIKDGYNLDLLPDDEDLDLIPPRPVHERCICCQPPVTTGCVLQ